jgi:small subunit ribosomal protein S3Ae
LSKRGRKIQDKWKMKDWYNIIAPSFFGGVSLGITPSSEPNKMLGRTIEVTLYDITGDVQQQHIALYFQVSNLRGNDADTVFKGHEYSRDYLRSLIRRGSTRVDTIFNLTTRDGYKLRVAVVALSLLRIRRSQIMGIREIIRNILEEKGKLLNFDQFIQEAVLGKIASDIYNEAKKVSPLRHVGIRKTKLIQSPDIKPTATVELEANA